MIIYDQSKYIETTKGIVKEYIQTNAGMDVDVPVAFPNISDESLSLEKPNVYIEYVRDLNLDVKGGKRTGKGTRRKRKRLTFALYVITQGDARSVLERDRILQNLQGEIVKSAQIEFLSGKGIYEPEMTYMGSYAAREGVHLARLEFYFQIHFIN
jgi:hypothetical protein